MDEVIIDTSVVIKWFVQEENSDKALKIFEKIKKNSLKIVLPQIIKLELINALLLGNNYTQEGAIKALSDVNDLRPEWVIFDSLLARQVIKIVSEHKIAAYDALFLALAEDRQISLITADQKHHQKKFSKFIKYL